MPTSSSSTASATNSSQFSPASTVISAPAQALPPGARPRVADADDGAVEAGVGDDQVAAAAEHEHRLAGVVGSGDRGVQLGAVVGLDPLRPGHRAAAWSSAAQPLAPRSVSSRTTARQTPSTFWPSLVDGDVDRRRPSSTDLTTPVASTTVPTSSSGTTTGLVNRAPNDLDRGGSPTQVVTARPASASVYMPCAITPGSGTDVATRSLQWIGLKSPEAPA